jgi:hypothetical protein
VARVTAATPQPTRNTPVDLRDLVRRLDWRLELLSVAVVLAEAALVYLACGLLLAGDRPRYEVLPLWIVVMLLLVAHLTPHLLDEWRVWSPQYELIVGTAIVVTLLAAIKWGSFPGIALWDTAWLRGMLHGLAFLPNPSARPVWGLIVLASYAWWRGRTRADPTIDSAYTLLRVGSLFLALLLIITLASMPETAQVRDRLSAGTLAFFVCTLSAIGISRLKLEGFRTSAPLGPRWLATFVAPILAVVVVAVIAAGIFSRQFLDTTLWLLSPILWFMAVTLQIFIIILAVIAFIVITPVLWLIGSRHPQPVKPTQPANNNGGLQGLQDRAGDAIHVPDPLRYLIVAIILFALFSALAHFAFRRRRRERETTDEQRESVLDWSDLLGSLANQLTGLFRRPKPADPLAHLRGDPRWRHTLAIREAYAQLQARGASAGRPRRRAETADEYRPQVSERLPHVSETSSAVAELTEIYRQTRYTGEPADEAAATRARAAWERIARTADHTGG